MDLIIIVFSIIIVSLSDIILRKTYRKYGSIDNIKEISGYETAKMILEKNNLSNISVGEVSGNLTDHYNNSKKVINLSSDIYDGTSIASVSVAAHECGHAIQYKEGYLLIKIRNMLVPFVNFGNYMGYIVICISLATSLSKLLLLGIVLISFALLFQIITLPVEFDASRRGRKELYEMGLISEEEVGGVKSMLYAAAFTYVASLISSILEILRLVLIFTDNDD